MATPTHTMTPKEQLQDTTLLRVQDLSVEFDHPLGTPVRAVNDVSLTLNRGERLAIVGESGSGKSVLSLSIMGMVPGSGRISGGSVELGGRDLTTLSQQQLRAVRGQEVAMVFQDPSTSLNPVMTIADQMVRPMQFHLGLSRKAALVRAAELLEQTGIPDPGRNLRNYPHQLSGGMRQRVMIAMALSCDPHLLLADEPTTALDVTVQAQIVERLRTLSEEHHSAVIFVTHDMGLVARFADRVAVMYAGRIVEQGPVREVFAAASHPYTQGLLASIPSLDGDLPERLHQIDGSPPDPAKLPPGCAFAGRCPSAMDRCSSTPPTIQHTDHHEASCWLLDQNGASS